MDTNTILTIVSIVLGLAATLLGGKWLIAKNKLNQFGNVLKEGYDVISTAIDSVEDNKIEPVELDNIKKEIGEFSAALKLLFGK